VSALRSLAARALVLVVLAELTAWLGFRLGVHQRLRSLLWDPPVARALADYDRHMRWRHPQLGWPAKTPGGSVRDRSGSRWVPAYPEPGDACVALYGDSFTFGDELDDEHAWGNVLARALRCRVANYGVNGYGIDQAYLSFLLHEEDEAPTVVLTIYPQNVMRSVNQLRALLTGDGSHLSFKPRFVVADDGRLTLAPVLAPRKREIPALLANPARFLPHEYFLPGSTAGPVPYGFPYLVALARLLRNDLVRAGVMTIVTGRPAWAAFYEPGHPSRSFEVTTAIVEQFQETATGRQKRLVVFMLPTPSSMRYVERAGTSGYDGFLAHLQARGIDVVDLGPAFRTALAGRPFTEITTVHTTRGGHLNEEGAVLHAAIVERQLRDRGLILDGTRSTRIRSGAVRERAGRPGEPARTRSP